MIITIDVDVEDQDDVEDEEDIGEDVEDIGGG